VSEAPPLNQQIVDAVDTSTSYALGLLPTVDGGGDADPVVLSAGAAIAYDKAVQAAAIATQDAADYERNVLSISAAVQGKALAMILATEDVDPTSGPVAAWVLAVVSSLIAPVSAGLAASTVTLAVKEFFPRT
jgi:hypothetical protein